MAHKMGTGSTQNGRDSNAQRRGLKAFGGQTVTAGSIIVRQCGSRFKAGFGASTGRDYTIFATQAGVVRFRNRFIDVVAAPPAAADKA
jgi:large subunit ribosomal protein L27